MTSDQIENFLDTEFESMDLGKTTPRKYLFELLHTLWIEKEGFSGKRPFGNSGWDSDLALALVEGGFIKGYIEGGWAQRYERNELDQWVRRAICHIFYAR